MATVLITGTSTGIGLATALRVRPRRATPSAATMRNPPAGRRHRASRDDCRRARNCRSRSSTMDVDDDRLCPATAMRRRSSARSGAIDVLVNNAGIDRSGSVEELPLADFRAVMETNYFGVIRCIQAVLPAMRQRRERLHRQRLVGRRPHFRRAPLAPYSAIEVRARGPQRVVGAGSQALQRTRRHRQTWHRRYADGAAHRCRSRRVAVSPAGAILGALPNRVDEPGSAVARRRQDARDLHE